MSILRFESTPITWSRRLQQWDVEMLKAFEKKTIFECNQVKDDYPLDTGLTKLFVSTMQLGAKIPFPKEATQALMGTWHALVEHKNLSWDTLDSTGGSKFLNTIIRSDPDGALEYLLLKFKQPFVKDQTACWIAIAAQLAVLLPVKSMIPLLRSPQLHLKKQNAQAKIEMLLAIQTFASQSPWEDAETLFNRFDVYPDIQDILLSWIGVWSVELVHQDMNWTYVKHNVADQATLTHGISLKAPVVQEYLRYRFGLNPDPIESDIRINARAGRIRKAWAYFELYAEHKHQARDKFILPLVEQWILATKTLVGSPPPSTNGWLMGNNKDYQGKVSTFLREELLNNANPELNTILEALPFLPKEITQEYKEQLSSVVLPYILDFVENAGSAITTEKNCLDYFQWFTPSAILELANSSVLNENLVFWKIIENPEYLSEDTRESLLCEPSNTTRSALLQRTIVEAYGVKNWGVLPEDNIHLTWLDTLAIWFPEHAASWEELQRNYVLNSDNGLDALLDVHFTLEGLELIKMTLLLDMSSSTKSQTPARQAFSGSRSWQIDMPRQTQNLFWVRNFNVFKQHSNEYLPLPSMG